MRVIVVGGGWAGLAAALELCAHGTEVTLFEAAPQLGGRARTVERDGLYFDNGQHIVIGAYRATLRMLALAGVAESTVFTRRPLRWLMRGGVTVDIAAPRWLPAPLHMAWALLSARGYGWSERVAALRACGAVLRNEPSGGDMAVADWLRQHAQPPRVVASLWEPLCLAALNTPMAYASAEIFVRVLRDAFLERRTDADLLLPRCDLGAVFPAPAAESIRSRGGRLRLNERVLGLTSEATRVTGVRSRHGEHTADHVIVALPPRACAALLDDRAALAPLAAQLAAFEHEPICTAYLRVSGLSLAAPMTGLVATRGQWLFDLRHCGKPGWVAVVISGPGEHMNLGNEQLLAVLASEIAELFGAAARVAEGFVIREKRATFSCRVGINAQRPGARTELAGLWLAGDFTATGYPATLEGAVRSGVGAARDVLKDG